MGTMRNNFGAVFVLLILMLSTGQSLLQHSNVNSWKRNSRTAILTSEPRSSSSLIYECLFIDPNLPICDVDVMLNSEEDSRSNKNSFNRDVTQRWKRDIDVSAMDVVIHTIEGCLPSRLPFSMPSCEGISLDRIVDVQKFRPFVVKGVRKPPFVFPKFDYSEWEKMMTRLRNHASKKQNEEEHASVTEDSSIDRSVHDRTEELINAATMKETIPKAMVASINSSNESSPNRLIPGNSKSSVSSEQLGATIDAASSAGRIATLSASTFLNAAIPSFLQFHKRLSSMESTNESRDRSRFHVLGQETPAIPSIPSIPESAMDEPSNELLHDSKSKKFRNLFSDMELEEADKQMQHDFPIAEMIMGSFRRRREARLPLYAREIPAERKTRGIEKKSINRLLQYGGENSKKFVYPGTRNKKRASSSFDDQASVGSLSDLDLTIPHDSQKTDDASVNQEFRGKFGSAGRLKPTLQKAAMKVTTSKNKNSL